MSTASRTIPPDVARLIWAIISEECRASATPTWVCPDAEVYGWRFRVALANGVGCYCFDQRLGGLFHADEDPWCVTYNPAYMTPGMVEVVTRVNARLAALRAEVAAGADQEAEGGPIMSTTDPTSSPTATLASLRRWVAWRLAELRENLAGWHEGRICPCTVARPANPRCTNCNGTGIQAGTTGYLVPTEPDPEERVVVRRELRAAIAELEAVGERIGLKEP